MTDLLDTDMVGFNMRRTEVGRKYAEALVTFVEGGSFDTRSRQDSAKGAIYCIRRYAEYYAWCKMNAATPVGVQSLKTLVDKYTSSGFNSDYPTWHQFCMWYIRDLCEAYVLCDECSGLKSSLERLRLEIIVGHQTSIGKQYPTNPCVGPLAYSDLCSALDGERPNPFNICYTEDERRWTDVDPTTFINEYLNDLGFNVGCDGAALSYHFTVIRNALTQLIGPYVGGKHAVELIKRRLNVRYSLFYSMPIRLLDSNGEHPVMSGDLLKVASRNNPWLGTCSAWPAQNAMDCWARSQILTQQDGALSFFDLQYPIIETHKWRMPVLARVGCRTDVINKVVEDGGRCIYTQVAEPGAIRGGHRTPKQLPHTVVSEKRS